MSKSTTLIRLGKIGGEIWKNMTDSAGAEQDETCPECEGRLLATGDGGEIVCQDCGLVVEEDKIDPGPEWRAFDSKEKDEKSRVGAPMTNMMHDKGLSTNIDWRDKDAYGNSLSSNQREKMQRLRKWQERIRTKDAGERNLKYALGEIDRMGSELEIEDPTREIASVIYRRALDEDLIRGRSMEGIAAAAVYLSCRQERHPRPLSEITEAARVERQTIGRAVNFLQRNLELPTPPPDPRNHIAPIVSKLRLPPDVEATAVGVMTAAMDEKLHSGRSPVALAAVVVMAASSIQGKGKTTREAADAAGVSAATIRNRYKELQETVDLDSEVRALIH